MNKANNVKKHFVRYHIAAAPGLGLQFLAMATYHKDVISPCGKGVELLGASIPLDIRKLGRHNESFAPSCLYRVQLGGNWDNSTYCGSRCANGNNPSANLNANNGARAVSESGELTFDVTRYRFCGHQSRKKPYPRLVMSAVASPKRLPEYTTGQQASSKKSESCALQECLQ